MRLYELLKNTRVNSNQFIIGKLPLQALVKVAKLPVKSQYKDDLVNALYHYLMQPDNIRRIWKNLSDFEKDCVRDYKHNFGYLFEQHVEKLEKRYGIREGSFYGQSKASLLIINGIIPEEVLEVLEDELQLQGMEIACGELTDDMKAEGYQFVNNELLYKDIIEVVKLVSKGKLKCTKSDGIPTKAAFKRINEVVENKEYATYELGIDSITKGSDTIRLMGLYHALMYTDVIDLEGTTLVLGSMAQKFLHLSFSEQMKMLYGGYLENGHYNEVERIRGGRFQAGYTMGMLQARMNVISAVTMAPLGQWVDMESLAGEYYEKWRTFLDEELPNIAIRTNGYIWGGSRFDGDWQRLERPYMDVVLLEGLAPLGIIDVVVQEEEVVEPISELWVDRLRVKAFRLTELGAYLLGQSDTYDDPTLRDKVQNDLVVDRGLCVRVGESVKRYQHEIFFGHFAIPVQDGEVTCFQLDFQAALKAFNEGISIASIGEYLKKWCTEDLPQRLESVLHKWEQDQKKVRIRMVTVIECDEKEIMEELLENAMIKRNGGKALSHAIEVNSGVANKLKAEIEKQCYFCTVE